MCNYQLGIANDINFHFAIDKWEEKKVQVNERDGNGKIRFVNKSTLFKYTQSEH